MEIKKNKNRITKITDKKWAVGGSIIAAVCIVIYLFALIQGALRIYLSIDERKITAEREFSAIAALAYTAGLQGFMNDSYIQTMNDALASSESIEAFIITGADIGYAFDRQPDNAITWVNNQPRFINKFGISNQDLYRPLSFTDTRNANIKAVAGRFDYIKITDILKQTLLIILAGFAIAFLTMLVQLLVRKPVQGEMVYVETAEPKKKPARKDTHAGAKKTGGAEARVTDSDDDYIFQADPEQAPKGLFSQRSGLGWEEYIKDRLNSELHRCSSVENDLVLIMMNFKDISDDSTFKTAADEAARFFSSRDLLFEYGQSGITAIIPGIDLDTGISKSEKFYQRAAEKFAGDSAYGLCIGISSRAGRLVNADRLLLETSEALKRAGRDTVTSIIGFRSDPDKYREYIKNRS